MFCHYYIEKKCVAIYMIELDMHYILMHMYTCLICPSRHTSEYLEIDRSSVLLIHCVVYLLLV